jgi:plastocyanin
MSRRYAIMVLLSFGLAACPNQSPRVHFSPTGRQIDATKTLTFDPIMLSVQKGDTIQWGNDSGIDHNVTFENGPEFRQALPNEHGISRTFTTVGTFNYYCAIHGKSMHGTVVVT